MTRSGEGTPAGRACRRRTWTVRSVSGLEGAFPHPAVTESRYAASRFSDELRAFETSIGLELRDAATHRRARAPCLSPRAVWCIGRRSLRAWGGELPMIRRRDCFKLGLAAGG